MLSNKVSKLFILLGVVIIAASFYIWQSMWLKDFNENDAIAKGISIAGHDVGGYDTESAVHMLSLQLKNELSSKNIEISYNDIKTTINVASFASLDFKSSLDAAYEIGRTGNKTQDYMDLLKAKISGVSLNAKITFDESALKKLLEDASTQYFIAPKDASISAFNPEAEGDAMLAIESQQNGRELDIKKTAENIKQAVISGNQKAEAVTDVAYAKISDDVLHGLTLDPVLSEYAINAPSSDYATVLNQVIGNGIHRILLPGDELSIINFMGGSDYIINQMPEGGSGSDYEKVLTQIYPTQIYLAAVLSELEIVERKMYNADEANIPIGTSCITDKENDLIIKNTLDYPIIIRVGYDYKASNGIAFCEIYRSQMEWGTYVKSVIRKKDGKSLVDIVRVYVDNKGNTVDTVVAETVNID